MTTDSPLLDSIEAFLTRTGMSPTAFGKSAIGDPNFVLDIRRGREPRSRLVRRAEEFMRDHPASPPTSSSDETEHQGADQS